VVKIDAIGEAGACGEETTYKRLGGILVDRALSSPPCSNPLLWNSSKWGNCRQQHQIPDALSSIRVATDKLDCLVNLVGELMTVQAHLSQTVVSVNMPALHSIAEEIERLIASLRDTTMKHPHVAHRHSLQQVWASGPRPFSGASAKRSC